MKIGHAELHMYTNIMYKFQSSTCKTLGEKLQTKLCPWKDGRTAMAIPVYPPPLCFGGYNNDIMSTIWTKWEYSYLIKSKNFLGKREIAHYEQFLLIPQCFQKLSVVDVSK